MKYIWYHKLFRDEWALNYAFVYQANLLSKFTLYLNEKYPNLFSLLDLDVEKGEREWIFWLEANGTKTKKSIYSAGEGTSYVKQISNFFRLIHSSLFGLTDTREEWDKDHWDVRALYEKFGIDYNKSLTSYYIDFGKIQLQNVREQVKKYIKQRLLSKRHFSFNTAMNYLTFLPPFINFIFLIEPTWRDLKALKRSHILKYLEWLHEYSENNLKSKNAHPEIYVSKALTTVQRFLEDIQRYEYEIAPEKNIRQLILPEDKPKLKKKSIDQINYIPDLVLDQLFSHLNYFIKMFSQCCGLRLKQVYAFLMF